MIRSGDPIKVLISSIENERVAKHDDGLQSIPGPSSSSIFISSSDSSDSEDESHNSWNLLDLWDDWVDSDNDSEAIDLDY